MKITRTSDTHRWTPKRVDAEGQAPTEPAPVDYVFTVDGFAAELSRLAYMRANVAKRQLIGAGASHVKVLSSAPAWMGRGQMMGLACVYEGRAWIALRGTDEFDDWTLNVLFLPFTHPGFRAAWGMLEAETRAYAKEIAKAAEGLVVTGHSLGGAMAFLAAADFSADGLPIEAVVTFGAPRVGSPIFARRWNARSTNTGASLGSITRRYETYGEAVCHVPPFLFGFKHVGQAAIFPSSGFVAFSQGTLVRRVRATGAEVLGFLAIPFLLIKLLVFAADREAFHRMDLYLDCLGVKRRLFDATDADKDSRYRIGAISGPSWIILGAVVLTSLALVGTAMWLTLSWTGMHPLVALLYIGVFVWAMPDTGTPSHLTKRIPGT